MSRLALTTTVDRSRSLAERCEATGLVPVFLPCIEAVPASSEAIERARVEADRADWLVVTSARTVEVLWPSGGMPAVKLAAVGESTAAAIRRAGRSPEAVGDDGASRLVDRIRHEVAGRDVFFPHSTRADQATVDALADAGAVVATASVYDIRSKAPGPDVVDAVVFASPSAVTGWSLSRSFDRVDVGAIGSTTAAALADMGVTPDVTPPSPSLDDLIGLIAGRLRQRSKL